LEKKIAPSPQFVSSSPDQFFPSSLIVPPLPASPPPTLRPS